jgi:glyoxylase-like metal-dependent hydrolase (beta-lactamase superfamily II)
MPHQVATLTFDVHVADGVPIVGAPPPGERQRFWSPISATLIAGERDAVLVDALMTVDQARELVDWVAAGGKSLTTVYITHGHGDHWFGLGAVLERFPDARAVALPAVVEYMRQTSTPERIASLWKSRLPGQIPDQLVFPEPLDGDRFELEGHELVAIPVGHTDTDQTTVLHVPDIGLVVAGDAAYNDVHLYLAESTPELRREWLAALDTIESLNPSAVVAGHKRPGRADDPQIVEETRRYIRDFDRIAANTGTAQELYEQVLALHPDRVNPGALWHSAEVAKP